MGSRIGAASQSVLNWHNCQCDQLHCDQLSLREWWEEEQAVILRHKMRATSMTVDVMSFCVANSSCEKGEQWDRAPVLFHKLCEIGRTANVISFSSAVAACQKRGW